MKARTEREERMKTAKRKMGLTKQKLGRGRIIQEKKRKKRTKEETGTI